MSGNRYVVVGAGGVGGVVAGYLAAGGKDVVLVARGEHERRIRTNGLTIASPRGTFVAHPEVVGSVHDWQPQARDVVILAVKSQDATGLVAELAAKRVGTSFAGDCLPLVCFQNGIANERTALRYFSAVHGVSVGLPGVYLEPGTVYAHGSPVPGVLEVGRYPQGSDEVDRRLVAVLGQVGFRAHETPEIVSWKAAKLIGNLRNALDVLYPAGQGSAAFAALTEAARAEAQACFEAASIPVVDPALVDEHRADFSEVPVEGTERPGGSTWQSVARGLPSVETDFLNGEIALLGRLYAVSTPVNEHVQRYMWELIATGGPAVERAPEDLLNSLGLEW